MHCRLRPTRKRRPSRGFRRTAAMQKSASRRRFIRFAVRARQKDGLPRGDHRPPDGSRISLEGVRGQGATVSSWAERPWLGS